MGMMNAYANTLKYQIVERGGSKFWFYEKFISVPMLLGRPHLVIFLKVFFLVSFPCYC